MKGLKKYVINGCDCFLTEIIGNQILQEFEERQEEMFYFTELRELRKIAEETNDPTQWGIYSDLFKDLYGVRPRPI